MDLKTKKLRKDALYLSQKCKDGNLQSVFSCMEIVWVLYNKIMNWSAEKANDKNRDYFIISKGQATLALYPVLAEKGLFALNEIAQEIGSFDSRYSIQVDITKFNGGMENNAGSLGHGFPFAAGLAYANKIQKKSSSVYVLCGDGEFCEGTMWETCLFAASRRIDKLCLIVDDNASVGGMGDFGSLENKLAAFGFEVFLVNGHNLQELEKVFEQIKTINNERPKAVIAKTIRGYGSPTMMQNDIWFHKAPNEEELLMLSREVDAFEEGVFT